MSLSSLYGTIIVVSYWICFYSSVMHVIVSGFLRSISICQEHQGLSDGRHQCWIHASQIKLLRFTSNNKHMADIDATGREERVLSVLKRYDVIQVSRSACLTQYKFQWLSSSNDACIDSNEQSVIYCIGGCVLLGYDACLHDAYGRTWIPRCVCRGEELRGGDFGLRGESDEFWYRKEWKPWIR